MKKSTFILLFVLIVFSGFAQSKSTNAFKITYKQFSNENSDNSQSFEIIFADGICFLSESKSTISNFIDFNRSENVNIIENSGKIYKTTSSFKDNPKPQNIDSDIEKINGYKCNKAVYKSFSNKIEVWYTTETKAKGSPYQTFLPDANSLVVKIVINGNRTIQIDEISELNKSDLPDYYYDQSIEISEPEFEELKILSRYTIVSIFNNERINFNTDMVKYEFDDLKSDTTYHLSNGGIILKKVKLPELAKNGAYCFAKLDVKSDGDAYDRTGSVFIVSTSSNETLLKSLFEGTELLPKFTDKNETEYQGYIPTETYKPAIEIMRFFTSFGAGHFSDKRLINNYNWKESILYKQEVTQLIPDNKEEIWIGVFIGNYDKGGHIVNLELDFYPSDDKEKKGEKFIMPLFNTVNIMEMSGQNYSRFFNTDTLRVEFEIPEGISEIELVFTTTGHGGWETGDEFVAKLNQIIIDNKTAFEIVPWRTDCGTYRYNNPASGNFSNGLSSSDLSRSNWCPGTLTPPYFVKLPNLKPGKHNLEVVIDQGDEIGNSFSSWSVSGIIIGNK